MTPMNPLHRAALGELLKIETAGEQISRLLAADRASLNRDEVETASELQAVFRDRAHKLVKHTRTSGSVR